MFDHIVVPLDFSPESEQAIAHAVEFARRGHVPVELLSIASERRHADASARLQELAAEPGVSSWTVVETDDDTDEVLFDEALSRPSALWFVGSHVRTALGEMILGSVSEDLVRDVQRPMVMVGPNATVPRVGDVIVVALDGSDASEKVVPVALEMARRFQLRLRMLQITGKSVAGDVNETAYLARVAGRLPAPGCRDYDVLHGGDATSALVDYVEVHPEVCLLAMTTHGVPAGAPRMIAGSTAFETTRRVEVPVLLYHPVSEQASSEEERGEQEPAVDPHPRVVVGVDSMEMSGEAVYWAADEAVRRGVPLSLVHAWIYPSYATTSFAYPVGADFEVVRTAAENELAGAVEAVKDRYPDLEVAGVLAEDTPGHQLIDQSIGADLLVVGSHHRGRLSEFLGLSVSAACTHRAECPVVVVPCRIPED